jgi:hypothetical protein
MRSGRIILIGFLLAGAPAAVFAQEREPATIRVKRESNLVKAVFDNTENRLMVVDRFGNPRENKIATYKLYVKAKRETKEFVGYGNSLTPEMMRYLNKLSSASKIFFTEISASASKIFFTEISATEDDGHLIKLPDVIDTWFPDCENCEKGKRR